jgi:alkaline phosphatase D
MEQPDLVIAFGSCNNQRMENQSWPSILSNDPDLFIWGGDNVYSNTEDMDQMREAYKMAEEEPGYADFCKKTEITGTWDDHDYGLNDGGSEWKWKDSVQQILLDFLDVDPQDPRRSRKGVYHTKSLTFNNRQIKVIVLDTRYFRSKLTKDISGVKRYVPNPYGEGTMLGEVQWQWLEQELTKSVADFHVIVSSIQFLSGEHGFETWANMPHEVDRMIALLQEKKPKGVIFLSGDRHIAEISSRTIDGLDYPLIDFTSSGMTHSYSTFSGEPNRYRISGVIADKNFGLLKFDMEDSRVSMEIRSVENELLAKHTQVY